MQTGPLIHGNFPGTFVFILTVERINRNLKKQHKHCDVLMYDSHNASNLLTVKLLTGSLTPSEISFNLSLLSLCPYP